MAKFFRMEKFNGDGKLLSIDCPTEPVDPLDPAAKLYISTNLAKIQITPMEALRKPAGDTEVYVVGNRSKIISTLEEMKIPPTSFTVNYPEDGDTERTTYILSVTRQSLRRIE